LTDLWLTSIRLAIAPPACLIGDSRPSDEPMPTLTMICAAFANVESAGMPPEPIQIESSAPFAVPNILRMMLLPMPTHCPAARSMRKWREAGAREAASRSVPSSKFHEVCSTVCKSRMSVPPTRPAPTPVCAVNTQKRNDQDCRRDDPSRLGCVGKSEFRSFTGRSDLMQGRLYQRRHSSRLESPISEPFAKTRCQRLLLPLTQTRDLPDPNPLICPRFHSAALIRSSVINLSFP
jgi:hypothetical protein